MSSIFLNKLLWFYQMDTNSSYSKVFPLRSMKNVNYMKHNQFNVSKLKCYLSLLNF